MSAWLGRSVRAVSGVAVLGAVAAVVAGGVRFPAAVAGHDDATAVEVPPAPTALTCPGPLVLPDDTGRGDGQFDPVPVAPETTLSALAVSSGGGSVTDLATDDEAAALGEGGAAVTVPGVDAPLVVNALPTDVSARAAGVVASLVTKGDLRGLAAASCQAPTADAWLVGGSTELSSTALLVLQNAGSTPVEAAVEVYGPSGLVDTGAERHLVAPGEQEVVVLGGVAAEQRRLAVHVTTTGGRVSAYLQDSAIDGFTAAGTDLVAPGAVPARRQVVPAVSVAEADVDQPGSGTLRLLVPGEKGATARVRILGADGVQDLPGAEAVDLAPGAVTDVPLGGLPAGAYTVVVDADRPVVASAVLSRPGDGTALDPGTPTLERAWAPSTEVGTGGTLAVPAGTRGSLVIGAVAEGDALDVDAVATGELRLLGEDGVVLATRQVRLRAGTSGAWDVRALAAGTGVVELGTDHSGAAGGPEVTGVDLVTTAGAPVRLAWGLVASVDEGTGPLLSVVAPVPPAAADSGAAVRADPRLGTR